MNDQYSGIHVESTLPRPWEEEQTFNDILYDWMSRAPWLLISAAAHVLVLFIIAAIPWSILSGDDSRTVQAQIEVPPEDLFEPEEEEIPEEEVEEIEEEPELQDSEVTETEVTEDYESTDIVSDIDDSFESSDLDSIIGLGYGAAGGKYGGRFGKARFKGAGRGTEEALKDGLEWLKNHQHPAGFWDCDGFDAECGKIGNNVCSGVGEPGFDVGITGLALLAFLGDGNTPNHGEYKEVVKSGIAWLKKQQDPDNGLIGDTNTREFLYNHAIATLAICEVYYFTKNPLLKKTAQKAVNYILLARNPYAAWRYHVPPDGDNDTSVTGWMVFALASAKEGGLDVDTAAFAGARTWFIDVTDPQSGRIGYNARGTLSSRVGGLNDHFPADKGEAMTAVGLLCRIFMGDDPAQEPLMIKHADLLKKKPPVWDPGSGCDMYYWYYGTYAMYQMGAHSPSYWKTWNTALQEAVVDTQRKDGDEKGSWDPAGPWGYAGGRIYSTALMVLSLEVYFRYAKVLGAR